MENSGDGWQLLTQISLGIGSALFGAMLDWIINQVLAEIRWRREAKESSAN